ncbi:MAG: TonB-dependent receptor [Desulfobulbaceae bacterium]|uniref:TonB-dependent receptor n=1 Tax=Candidatus Desulfatifera sulfidica TaxID=2841691 RepID=A0A8J6N9X9_9BACT|nr:TonB-dependent receptor [Candidatus Desulfatifera sulfidica]
MYLVDDKTEVSGGHLLGRWHRIFSKTSEMTFQAYYDRTSRTEAYLAQELEVFDLDFQHRWRGIQKHDIIWGARYRYSKDDFVPSYVVTFDQESRNDELYSFFVQDEITLVDDRLWLTLGSKFEHNDYTGTEIQPSGRLLWIPKHNHRLWTSISRAVRTPSRLESDGLLVTAVMPPSAESLLPVEVLFASDQTFDSENLTAYEVGYRFITDRNLSIDLTAFYNDYDELRSVSEPTIIPQLLPPTPHVESLYYFVNDSQARSYGLELALAYQVTDWLQVDLGYSYINSDADFLAEEPTHQVSLRSAFKIRDDLDLDVWLRYVDKTRSLFTTNEDGYYEIDEYLACDIRLAWRPTEKLELSLVGQNLLDGGHLEFVQEKFTFPTELPRGVYGKVSYKF